MCKQQSCVGNTDHTTGIAVFFIFNNMYFTTNHTGKAWNITDTDGNVMEPARLRVRTPDTAGHDPLYAAHEKVARQAAQDGIALLKNDRGVLPLPGSTDDTYTEPLEAAVRDGRVSMGQLQQNVRRLVAGLLRLQKGGL